MRALAFAAFVGAVLSLSGCGWAGMLWCVTFTHENDCAP